MGTRVVLDDELVGRARQLTGIATNGAQWRQPCAPFFAYRHKGMIRQLRGKLLWEDNLVEQRQRRGECVNHERQ